MKERLIANFNIALEAVLANTVRSLLTALGIIFGVGAVISMMAIGAGAEQDILDQMKLVGVNNIVITPVVEQEDDAVEEELGKTEKRKFSPGLTLADATNILATLPNVEAVSPEIIQDTYVISNGKRRSVKLVGVQPSYFEVSNFDLARGSMFNETQLLKGAPVCIIGQSIKAKFFPKEDPIGKQLKVGPHWMQVVGVLKERYISNQSISKLGIRDYNLDVYIPVQTMLVRYINRALVTESKLRASGGRVIRGPGFISVSGGSDDDSGGKVKNYHQLDKLTIQMQNTEQLYAAADVVARLLERRHFEVVDYSVRIPEMELKQQQKSKQTFNVVLGAIAFISLLVGGIGIMNIMLASVLERIKEIGLRLSIGAQSVDIVLQFLFEAMVVSIAGGLVGILLGVISAYVISNYADIPTIISPASIFISFGVAAGVGLIFGIAPARKAARQDPITSLRHE